MNPASDPMGAPTSFTARRPHASNLPSFELPPPPLGAMNNKYQTFPHLNGTANPGSTTLTSVGNLLTPPSAGSSDGLTPTSGVTSGGSSQSGTAAYTPASSMWPPPPTASNPYGFQNGNSGSPFGSQGRTLFSPSLNSLVRNGSNSPTGGAYDMQHYGPTSMPVSTSSLPALHSQQQQQQHHQHMMGAQQNGHGSPAGQDAYARQPPTPTYFPTSQPTHQSSYSYTGSPAMSAGGAMKMGGSTPTSMPPLQPQFNRGYTYPLAGPVLSNINNPSGQLQMVGGNMSQHGMMPGAGYNSGHAAAHMQQMYGQHPQHHQAMAHHHMHGGVGPQNDRPFRCDQCPQSFNRNHDLKRHKRIHLAVKPFPCGHCDKSFSRKDALKRHVLVKGCGKHGASSSIKELDGSSSPSSSKSGGSTRSSPVITATA